MAESSTVYEIPNAANIDGLNLGTKVFVAVHTRKLDEQRLSKDENILLATYPRTGTTWVSHIISLLLVGEENYEATKNISLIDRVPYLEAKSKDRPCPYIDILDQYPKPRVVKTHLPFRFIKKWITEDKLKTIVTSRNPKDTLVSLYYFYLTMDGFSFDGSWNDFFEHVKAGKQLYGDQLEWLQDWDRNKVNGDILFLTYEDMKHDTKKEVRKITEFLNTKISEDHLQRLVRDVNIQVMKQEPPAQFQSMTQGPNEKFVRKGQVGEWKKYFTVDQNEWFNAKYKQSYEKLGIDVVYD